MPLVFAKFKDIISGVNIAVLSGSFPLKIPKKRGLVFEYMMDGIKRFGTCLLKKLKMTEAITYGFYANPFLYSKLIQPLSQNASLKGHLSPRILTL